MAARKLPVNHNVPWNWLSYLCTQMGQEVTGRNTLIATVYDPRQENNPGETVADLTSSGTYFQPDFDDTFINGWYLPNKILNSRSFVPRSKLRPDNPEGVKNLSALLGVSYHEFGHAKFTKWGLALKRHATHFGIPELDGKPITATDHQMMTSLEELRVEAKILEEFEVKSHLTNTFFKETATWVKNPERLQGLGPLVLLLGRDHLGLLDTTEHPRHFDKLLEIVSKNYDADKLKAFFDILDQLSKVDDEDWREMARLGREVQALEICPPQPDMGAAMSLNCEMGTKAGEALQQLLESMMAAAGMNGEGKETEGEGGGKSAKGKPGDKEEKGKETGGAGEGEGEESKKGGAGSATGKPVELTKEAQEALSSLLEEVAQEGDGLMATSFFEAGMGRKEKVKMHPVDPLNPTEPIKYAGGHGYSPDSGSAIHIAPRPPSGHERAEAISFGHRLQKIRLRNRERLRTPTYVPPGRLHMGSVMQNDAMHSRGMVQEKPSFRQMRSQHTELPRLQVAIGVDISGSMGGIAPATAQLGWVLAQGLAKNDCDYGFFLFKEAVGRVAALENVGSNVYDWSADGGSESIGTMLKEADEYLSLTGKSGVEKTAKAVIVLSDFQFVNSTEKSAGQKKAKELIDNGVSIFAIGEENYAHSAQQNLPGCVFIPWKSQNTEMFREVTDQLIAQLKKIDRPESGIEF